MPKKRSGGGTSPVQLAAKFLGVSVLAGAVMAGIALPAAGRSRARGQGSVKGFDDIPANLQSPQLSQRTTILDSQGGQIATVYSRDRTVVDLKDISPYMQKALVAIEDSRFYQHGAIDLKGVLRALNQNAQSGGVAQGASTLTQQLVKNYFVEEAGDDPTKVAQATQQTVGRKIRELKYAIQIEEKLGKKKDPRELPEHHVLRPAGVRRRGRRLSGTSPSTPRTEPAGVRAARGPRPVAQRYDP